MDDPTPRLATRLADLRAQRAWSLDQLAEASGVSRATLSRLEKAEVSPTAEVLARLCAAHGLSMSQLLAMVEDRFAPHVPRAAQFVWRDGGQGFVRRAVSPASPGLAAEVLECKLGPGTDIYDAPPVSGQEHHLVMTAGQLRVEIGADIHALRQGDALRYRLYGPSRFSTEGVGAKYMLILVTP